MRGAAACFILLGGVVGCGNNPGPDIACGSGATCPSGYTCAPATNRCVFVGFGGSDAQPPPPDARPPAPDAFVVKQDAPLPPDATVLIDAAIATPDAAPPPADAHPGDAPPAPADAHPADAAPGPDARRPDARPPDARLPDAPLPDAPLPDAAEPDAAEPDAAEPDAAEPDAAEPDAMALPPIITAVAVMGQPGKQLRQGDTTRVVIVTGTGLAGATLSAGSLVFAVSDWSDTMVTAGVTVPHGHARGLLDLTATSPDGADTALGALEITAITATTGGDDATGAGTPDQPWRTVTAATGAAAAGDRVQLGPGDFTAGETFPLTVAHGVELAGDTTSPSRILRGAGSSQVVTVEEGASLTDLFISQTAGGDCVDVRQASPTPTGESVSLANLELDTCVRAIDDLAVALTVDTVTARNISGVAVVLAASATDAQAFSIDGLIVEDAAMGALSVTNKADLTLVNSNLTSASAAAVQVNATGAVDLTGATNVFAGTPAIEDVRPARAMADGPVILLTGAKLGDMFFAAGTTATGPASNPPYWSIANDNNRLAF